MSIGFLYRSYCYSFNFSCLVIVIVRRALFGMWKGGVLKLYLIEWSLIILILGWGIIFFIIVTQSVANVGKWLILLIDIQVVSSLSVRCVLRSKVFTIVLFARKYMIWELGEPYWIACLHKH